MAEIDDTISNEVVKDEAFVEQEVAVPNEELETSDTAEITMDEEGGAEINFDPNAMSGLETENHFSNLLKEYNIKIKTLDLNLKYFGFRWWHLLFVKKNISKIGITEFDLVIDLQSKIRNTLILKRIPCINFYSPTYNFIFCSKKCCRESKFH